MIQLYNNDNNKDLPQILIKMSSLEPLSMAHISTFPGLTMYNIWTAFKNIYIWYIWSYLFCFKLTPASLTVENGTLMKINHPIPTNSPKTEAAPAYHLEVSARDNRGISARYSPRVAVCDCGAHGQCSWTQVIPQDIFIIDMKKERN